MYTNRLAEVGIDSVIGNSLHPKGGYLLGAVATSPCNSQCDEQLMCNPFLALDAMSPLEGNVIVIRRATVLSIISSALSLVSFHPIVRSLSLLLVRKR